jgi:hypothetical protein
MLIPDIVDGEGRGAHWEIGGTSYLGSLRGRRHCIESYAGRLSEEAKGTQRGTLAESTGLSTPA